MKKIISAILTLVTVLAMLASCGGGAKTPEQLLDEADTKLASSTYKATMDMNFSTDNSEVNAILQQMNLDTVIYFDGDNYSTTMMGAEMIFADDVVYISMNGQKMKQTLTEEQAAQLKGESSVTADFNNDMFESIELSEANGKQTITCTNLKDSAVEDILAQVEGVYDEGAEVTIGDVKLVVVLKDGAYESMSMEVSYNMTVMGQSISLDFDMNLVIDASAGKTITAPADADSYLEAPLGIV